MIKAQVLRKNRTLKEITLNEKQDDFEYEGHSYFIYPDRVFLRRRFTGLKPYLFYLEGIPEPIDLTRLHKIDKSNFKLYLDSGTVHELTSQKILKVLVQQSLEAKDMLIIILIGINIAISIVGMFGL